MKCISCETSIDPKWKHAIDINVCPFCGKHIMEEHLKNCLVALSSAMDEMAKYPEQLNDWLLSNHNYIKTSSPDLKSFLPKEVIKEMRKEIDEEEFLEKKRNFVTIKTPDGEHHEIEIESNIQSEAKTNGFHERAAGKLPKKREVSPDAPKSVAEKTQYLKGLADRIKKDATAGLSGEGGQVSMITPEMLENADPEEIAEFQSMITTGDIVASSLPDTSTGDDEEIPNVVLAMAGMKKKSGGADGGPNEKDIRAFQEMQNKARNSQKRLESGAGKFSRS